MYGASGDETREVEYQDVYAILVGNTSLEYQLPQHHKCACHLLNLVAAADATAAEAVTHTRGLKPCIVEQNQIHAFEIVEHECKVRFLKFSGICWNSLYLSVDIARRKCNLY